MILNNFIGIMFKKNIFTKNRDNKNKHIFKIFFKKLLNNIYIEYILNK